MSPRDANLFAQWTGVRSHAVAVLGFECVPITKGEGVVAIGALDGAEIHFAIAPSWRGRLITRRELRAYLSPLLQRLGILTTRVMVDAESMAKRQFLERLGFIKTGDSSAPGVSIEHFMLTHLKVDRS